MFMESNLTRMANKIAMQQHLVAESSIICISRSRRPVRELFDTLCTANNSNVIVSAYINSVRKSIISCNTNNPKETTQYCRNIVICSIIPY
jgi:hypothetical protein